MIKFDNVNFGYPPSQAIIKNFSLEIAPQESLAIIGTNGAGKSTLLKLIATILLPDSGTITIEEMISNEKNLSTLRKKIGFIFQNPDDQLFMPTAYDDISFGLKNYGDDQLTIEEKTNKILVALNISHLRNKPPHKLSGGEKRSVALASVMVMQPQIMLFDEPTAFLDLKQRRQLIKMVNDLALTKITVTHDLDFVDKTCNRVIILQAGKIFADGTPQEILNNHKLMSSAELI